MYPVPAVAGPQEILLATVRDPYVWQTVHLVASTVIPSFWYLSL